MLVNGRAGETEAHVKEALRLSPRDPLAFLWVFYEAAAKLLSGQDEEAAALFSRSIELYRNYPLSHLYLGAALQLLGRSEEAHKEAEIALQLNPKVTIRLIRAGAPSDNLVYSEAARAHHRSLARRGNPGGMSETQKIGDPWLVQASPGRGSHRRGCGRSRDRTDLAKSKTTSALASTPAIRRPLWKDRFPPKLRRPRPRSAMTADVESDCPARGLAA